MGRSKYTNRRSRRGPKDQIRLLVTFIVTMFLFAWAFVRPQMNDGSFLYAYYFISALGIWLVVRVALIPWASGFVSFFAFFAFYIALLSGGYLGKEKIKADLPKKPGTIQKTTQIDRDAFTERYLAANSSDIKIITIPGSDAGHRS